jgi:hypothetical protein
MWWKIYFWFYLVYEILSILGLIFLIRDGTARVGDVVLNLTYIVVSTIAVYIYVFRRGLKTKYSNKLLKFFSELEVFNPYFWRQSFFILIMIWLIYISSLIPPLNFISKSLQLMDVSVIEVLVGLIFDIPALVAIYKLGFKKS